MSAKETQMSASDPDEELTFASARIENGVVVHIHYARCEPCMYGSHEGGPHDWASSEDRLHAFETDQPDPKGQRCACDCYDLEPEPEPDWDRDGLGTDQPCSTCGEAGACGYDSEGRALIHATWMADDEEDA